MSEEIKQGFRLLFHAYMTGDDFGKSSAEAKQIDAALKSFAELWPNCHVALN